MANTTKAPLIYTLALTAPLATMSKFPLVPIFSAAHISKWDALPEDTHIHVTQSRFELERTMRSFVNDQPNDVDHDACVPEKGVFLTPCKITVRVPANKSHGKYIFYIPTVLF